jgi:hypothetical protein
MKEEYAKFITPAAPREIPPNRYPHGQNAVPFIVDPEYHNAPGIGGVALVARQYDVCAECTRAFRLYLAETAPAARKRLTEGEQREFAQRMPGIYRDLKNYMKPLKEGDH